MPRYVITELTEQDIRVLLASKTRKKPLTLEEAFVVPCADLGKDEEAMIQRGVRLRDALKQRKVAGSPAALIIPKQNAIVRTVTLPSGDAAELQEMAQFEAEKFIPFNAERHIISNSALHLDPIEGSIVLLTAIDGPVMESSLTIMRNGAVEPIFAEPSSVALVRAFHDFAEQKESEEIVFLLHIGTTQTEVNILRHGMLILSRSQAIGIDKLARDLQEAMHLGAPITPEQLAALDLQSPDGFLLEGGVSREVGENSGRTSVGEAARGWAQRLARFIRQSFDFAVREQGISTMNAIYLSGEGSLVKGLTQTLAPDFPVPINRFDPYLNMPFSGGPQNPALVAGMPTALGALLRLVDEEEHPQTRGDRVNLLPPEVIEQQVASERKVLLMISGMMVLITLVLIYLAYDQQADHREELRKRYTAFNREMAPIIDDLEKKEEQLDVIRRITTNRASPMLLLDQISAFPSVGSTRNKGLLTLTDFKYTTRQEVVIAGTVVNFEDMQRFADYLGRMTIDGRPVFRSVGLPQPTPMDLSSGRGTIYAFSITAVLTDLTAEDS